MPDTGGWYGLVAILQEMRDTANEQRSRAPEACPQDGEPLTSGPNGELFCPFDGFRWGG